MIKKRFYLLALICISLIFVSNNYAADLDLGSSDYPSSLDTNPSPQAGTENTNHLPGNGAIDASINIQTELGTDPAQSKSTLKAYLQTEHDTNGEHTFKNVYCFESTDIGTNQSAIFVPVSGADRWITSSIVWDPSSIASTALEAKEVGVTGAVLGDPVLVSFSIDVADLALTAQVTAADTVTATLLNNKGADYDLGSGTLSAKVLSNGSSYAASSYEMPWAGSVVGINIISDATITSGTCYGDATVNGTATGLQAQVDITNTVHHSAAQAKDLDAFSALDRLGVKLTSSTIFAPADTTSCTICVNVTFND